MTPLWVNLGGGVNSTALLCGYRERGITPDGIIVADTGDEKPETYRHLWALQGTLESWGFPSITVVRRHISRGKNAGGHVDTLEKECWANQTLPSRAFGFGGCSVKWKAQPIDGWLKRRYRPHLRAGGTIRRALGIDFGELGRAKFQPTGPFVWEYPLIDWRWERAQCIKAIERHGLRVPEKSACFYCPSSRKQEVVSLRRNHPDLYARAVEMERQARQAGGLKVKAGLGGRWAWEELPDDADETDNEQVCGCYDGG